MNQLDQIAERLHQQQTDQQDRTTGYGGNIPNAAADVHVPFPWMRELREESPVSEVHSYLIPYWYRLGERWVLYDALPSALIADDALQGGMILGSELREALNGPPPSSVEEWKRCPFVSDAQWEMWRVYGAYCKPFWVLEGAGGGHRTSFSPLEQNMAMAKNLPTEPPAVGSLPPCPFDNRTRDQLRRMNRLTQFANDLQKMRESGNVEWADQFMAAQEREIREVGLAFMEAQMQEVTEAAYSLINGPNARSEHHDQLIRVPDGTAARAKDAQEAYLETGFHDFKL